MYLSFLGYNTLHIHSKGACGWRALLLRLCCVIFLKGILKLQKLFRNFLVRKVSLCAISAF